MIAIKIDDTIIDIIDKIHSQEIGDIILDIPLGHAVLHNYISLKILKSKVKDRRLIIATSDRIGRKIGKRIGIEYSHIKNNDFLKESTQDILMKHNFSFGEYLKFQARAYFNEIKNLAETNKKLNSLGKYSKVYQEKTGLHIFFGALLSSILLLIFVYYFAVSKNYIRITPEVSIKKEAFNFIFKENVFNDISGDNKIVTIDIIDQKIYGEETYASSGIKNNNYDIAGGKIIIYNALSEELKLKPKTRFQTINGIIFELENWETIPPAVIDNFGKTSPGTKETSVVAQIKDISGNFTGSRGNINKDTSFILPGLDKSLQKSIYAQSTEDFQGGKDDFEKIILQKDIDQSRSLFEEKLKSDALRYIKNKISEENILNGTKKDILAGKQSIQYSSPLVFVGSGAIEGSIQNTFTLSGSINIQAYTYNTESIIQKLKTLIYEKNLEGVEKISHIDESSLRMNEIIYLQEEPFEMKATFEIESLYLHDFLHKENTYINQLKTKILGLSKEEAIKILVNDPKISNAEIEIRPFFVDTLSKIQNNIIFKVE